MQSLANFGIQRNHADGSGRELIASGMHAVQFPANAVAGQAGFDELIPGKNLSRAIRQAQGEVQGFLDGFAVWFFDFLQHWEMPFCRLSAAG